MTVETQPAPSHSVPPEWFSRLAGRYPALQSAVLLRQLTPPPGASPRHSAVLVLLGEGPDGPDVLLTQRATTLRSHAGQVAFPGGRLDDDDDGPVAAALREAQEETGVDPDGIDTVTPSVQLYVPPTDHLVTPVLGWWRRPSPVGPVDPGEVSRVERVPVAELTDPANRFRVAHPSGFLGPGFAVRDLFVWGFTAAVLNGVLVLGGWDRPWDDNRIVPLPDALTGSTPDPPGQAQRA